MVGRGRAPTRPSLVVLVGAPRAGKTHWAGGWFQADQIVSSDRLRAIVGRGERDAFEVVDLIVDKRRRRGLTTVIDSTGLEQRRRDAWRLLAERHGVPAYAVVFDTPASVVRDRNRALDSHGRSWSGTSSATTASLVPQTQN